MENELKQILKRVQYKSGGKTIEEIANEIGYSRVHFTKAVNEGISEKIKKRLLEYEKLLAIPNNEANRALHNPSTVDVLNRIEAEVKNNTAEIKNNAEILERLMASSNDISKNVVLNQALAKTELHFHASVEAKKSSDPEEELLHLIKAQNESTEANLRAIFHVKRSNSMLRDLVG